MWNQVKKALEKTGASVDIARIAYGAILARMTLAVGN